MPAGSSHCCLEDTVVSNTVCKEENEDFSVECALFLYQLVTIRAPPVRDLWPRTVPPVPFLWHCARASACEAVERVFIRITTSAGVSNVLRLSFSAAVSHRIYLGFCRKALRVHPVTTLILYSMRNWSRNE